MNRKIEGINRFSLHLKLNPSTSNNLYLLDILYYAEY